MPFYWLIKCLFMIWCMAPMENNRTEIIYARAFCPIFLKHQTKINAMVNKATAQAGDLVDKAFIKGLTL